MQRLLRPERNWHMLLLLGFAVLTGIAGLDPNIPASVVEANFPGWLRYLWYGGLVVCSSAAIWGYLHGVVSRVVDEADEGAVRAWMLRVMLGMSVERVAMILLAGLCATYTIGAIVIASDRVLTALSVGSVTAFAGANILRARQLRLALRHIHRKLDGADIDGPGLSRRLARRIRLWAAGVGR